MLKESLLELDNEYSKRLERAQANMFANIIDNNNNNNNNNSNNSSNINGNSRLKNNIQNIQLDGKTASKLFESSFKLECEIVAKTRYKIKRGDKLNNDDDVSCLYEMIVNASCDPFTWTKRHMDGSDNSNSNSSGNESESGMTIEDIFKQSKCGVYFSNETFIKIDKLIEKLFKKSTIYCGIKCRVESGVFIFALLYHMYRLFVNNKIYVRDPRLIGTKYFNSFYIKISSLLWLTRVEGFTKPCDAGILHFGRFEQRSSTEFDQFGDVIIKIAQNAMQ